MSIREESGGKKCFNKKVRVSAGGEGADEVIESEADTSEA